MMLQFCNQNEMFTEAAETILSITMFHAAATPAGQNTHLPSVQVEIHKLNINISFQGTPRSRQINRL